MLLLLFFGETVDYCKRIISGCVFLLAFLVECGFISLNAMHTCKYERSGIRKMKIHANLFKNYFPSNIVHAKYNSIVLTKIAYIQ